MIAKIKQFIASHDKIAHFAVGFLLGVLDIDWRFATTVFVGKEIFDCYKKYPTGFDLTDLAADYGGYALGLYANSKLTLLFYLL